MKLVGTPEKGAVSMGLLKDRAIRIKTTDNAVIECLHIEGKGTPIILIPGSGDGINTVGGFPNSYMLARMYKKYSRTHDIFVISRREPIPEGFTPRDFAMDYVMVMDKLEIDKAHIETNSAGGPIGQWIAIDFPDRVISLVLGSTMVYIDNRLNEILIQWLDWIEVDQWFKLYIDSVIKSYTPRYCRKYRWVFPILRLLKKPKNPDRIKRLFKGLLEFNNMDLINKISCPALVIGGDMDEITNLGMQTDMANAISGAKQIVLQGVGHGAYQEAKKEYESNILSFYDDVNGGNYED